MLTHVTGQLGFCLAVERDRLRLAQLHFVRVSSDRVMALLVSDGDVVRSRIFDERECDQRKLDRISGGALAAGRGAHARRGARAALGRDRGRPRASATRSGASSSRSARLGLELEVEAELYVGDRTRLLEQPEFEDGERLRELLRALDEKQRMLALLDNVLTAGSLCVVIGDELGDPGVARCAVVAEPVGGVAHRGGLGVIGPVRMRYDRVIPMVRYVSGQARRSLRLTLPRARVRRVGNERYQGAESRSARRADGGARRDGRRQAGRERRIGAGASAPARREGARRRAAPSSRIATSGSRRSSTTSAGAP